MKEYKQRCSLQHRRRRLYEKERETIKLPDRTVKENT